MTIEEESRFLDHYNNRTVYNPPQYVYIGLSTSTPDVDDGSNVTEPVDGNYARVLVDLSKVFGDAYVDALGRSSIHNIRKVDFPAAASTYGSPVTHIVEFTHATEIDSVRRVWTLSSSITPTAGQVVRIPECELVTRFTRSLPSSVVGGIVDVQLISDASLEQMDWVYYTSDNFRTDIRRLDLSDINKKAEEGALLINGDLYGNVIGRFTYDDTNDKIIFMGIDGTNGNDATYPSIFKMDPDGSNVSKIFDCTSLGTLATNTSLQKYEHLGVSMLPGADWLVYSLGDTLNKIEVDGSNSTAISLIDRVYHDFAIKPGSTFASGTVIIADGLLLSEIGYTGVTEESSSIAAVRCVVTPLGKVAASRDDGNVYLLPNGVGTSSILVHDGVFQEDGSYEQEWDRPLWADEDYVYYGDREKLFRVDWNGENKTYLGILPGTHMKIYTF